MKTNKIWSILVMLVVSVTAMFFTSCSSDDDRDGIKDINVQEVVGTWNCTASTDVVDGTPITGYMVGKSITISENGKFTSPQVLLAMAHGCLTEIKSLSRTLQVIHSAQLLLLVARP